MYEPEDHAYLSDMLECGRRTISFVSGYDETRYLADDKTMAAVEHMLQTIGEAAIKVSTNVTEAHPEIDWFKVRGLRHRIVHDYRRIDHKTIWRIAQLYVPPLVAQLERMLA